jgi:transmembrane 9 superfamily member 2/4
MREPQMCQIVCKATIDEKEAKELKEKIEDEYRVNM